MKTLGYIRVSKEEQARDGISLEMQTSKIRAYCELNDLDLSEIIEDRGISAKNIKGRPGMQRLLSLVNGRNIGAVVVYKLDRAFRNTIEALENASMMDKAEVALHSISEKLDTQSALGRFFFTLTASLAEMERGIISERTAAALSEKRAKGEKTGGPCPYGFTADADGRLIPHQGEQRAITRIRELRGDGFSYREISEALSREGTLTRTGKPFSNTQLVRILKEAA